MRRILAVSLLFALAADPAWAAYTVNWCTTEFRGISNAADTQPRVSNIPTRFFALADRQTRIPMFVDWWDFRTTGLLEITTDSRAGFEGSVCVDRDREGHAIDPPLSDGITAHQRRGTVTVGELVMVAAQCKSISVPYFFYSELNHQVFYFGPQYYNFAYENNYFSGVPSETESVLGFRRVPAHPRHLFDSSNQTSLYPGLCLSGSVEDALSDLAKTERTEHEMILYKADPETGGIKRVWRRGVGPCIAADTVQYQPDPDREEYETSVNCKAYSSYEEIPTGSIPACARTR